MQKKPAYHLEDIKPIFMPALETYFSDTDRTPANFNKVLKLFQTFPLSSIYSHLQYSSDQDSAYLLKNIDHYLINNADKIEHSALKKIFNTIYKNPYNGKLNHISYYNVYQDLGKFLNKNTNIDSFYEVIQYYSKINSISKMSEAFELMINSKSHNNVQSVIEKTQIMLSFGLKINPSLGIRYSRSAKKNLLTSVLNTTKPIDFKKTLLRFLLETGSNPNKIPLSTVSSKSDCALLTSIILERNPYFIPRSNASLLLFSNGCPEHFQTLLISKPQKMKEYFFGLEGKLNKIEAECKSSYLLQNTFKNNKEILIAFVEQIKILSLINKKEKKQFKTKRKEILSSNNNNVSFKEQLKIMMLEKQKPKKMVL